MVQALSAALEAAGEARVALAKARKDEPIVAPGGQPQADLDVGLLLARLAKTTEKIEEFTARTA